MLSVFNQGFNSSPRHRIVEYLLIGIVGSLIGCLLMATLFYFSFQGNLPPFFGSKEDAAPLVLDNGSFLEKNINGKASWLASEDEPYYMAVVKAAEKVMPSVVGITNYGIYRDFRGQTYLRERATGSGVIIDKSGLIITNNHVIENFHEITVTLDNGEEVPADLVGHDSFTDLAVLKIDAKNINLKASGFADSNNLKVGEPAIAIGNPLGLNFQQTVTVGVISATERQINIQGQNFNFIQTDAAINAGNSGGPLVNIRGEIIGINTAKISLAGVEGMGFAIPSNTVREIAKDLIEHGRVIRPWLGVYTRTVNPTLAQINGLPVDYGVFIEEVINNSPAQRGGLQAGDVIIEMAGKKVKDSASLLDIIYSHQVNDKVQIKVVRGSQELTVNVTLGSLPEDWS